MSVSSQDQAESSEAFEAEVARVIEIIRPAIQADEGDIFLRGVDATTGVVDVELVGACVTCPVSTGTLKDGLERILKQRVDGVTEVRHVGEPLAGADDGTAVSLAGGFGRSADEGSAVSLAGATTKRSPLESDDGLAR